MAVGADSDFRLESLPLPSPPPLPGSPQAPTLKDTTNTSLSHIPLPSHSFPGTASTRTTSESLGGGWREREVEGVFSSARQTFHPGTRRNQTGRTRCGTNPDSEKTRSIYHGLPAAKMGFPAGGLVPSESHPQSLSASRRKELSSMGPRGRVQTGSKNAVRTKN